MTALREHTVRAGAFELFVREAGAEGPLLPPRLLVHNALSSSLIWERVLPALAVATRVVAPDLPGHGRSSPLAAGAAAPDMPAVLVALLDALGLPRVDVVGASRGGGFAIALAARFAARVRRLVLVGATGMPERLRPIGALRARYGELVRDPALGAVVRERFAADAERAVAYERLRAQALTAGDRRDGLLPLARAIHAPTLLVWGEHDRHVPLAWAEELRAAIPGARLVVVPGVAHLPHYEAPEAFAAEVNEFLAAPETVPGPAR